MYFTCAFCVALIVLDSSHLVEVSVQPPNQALPGKRPPSLTPVTCAATTVIGLERGWELCCTEVPPRWTTPRTFKYGKEREEPQKHEWLQVEHGVDGVLEPCREGPG